MEANRVYQATRLYSTPPVYGESDKRRETGDYGLTHMVMTVTNRRCFEGTIRYLLPSEAAHVLQARKMFGLAVEAAEEQIVRHLHMLHFARVPLPFSSPATTGAAGEEGVGEGGGGGGGTCCSWTRYLHELATNKSHKLLIMGGDDGVGATNRVDMMVIDDEGTKISWQACAPMIKTRYAHSAYYCQGQVLSVSSLEGIDTNDQGTSERYDVLSQTAVELEQKLPIPNLYEIAMADLDGKAFAIGGMYKDAATDRRVVSDRVFCLDNKRHQGQAGPWIEQEARLIMARRGAAAATYQGKMWLAGGRDQNYQPLSSIEVFDPLVGSWQAAGDLTKTPSYSNIALFAIKDDLFAAKVGTYGMCVEKRDGQTGAWQIVSELIDGDRFGCALAACGSTIYFLGGNHNSSAKKIWNSFDTRTSMWASQQGQYKNEAKRQMPRTLIFGQAVCITPSEQLSGLGTWTSYPDFVHQEEEEEA